MFISKNNTLFISILFSLVLTACGGRVSQQLDSTGIEITLEAESMEVGRTDLIVTIQDGEGNPVNEAILEIKGDMSHAGMVPVLADTAGGTDGNYVVPFEWTMAGDWFVTVEVTLNDGTVISKRFNDFAINGEGEGMNHDEMEEDEMNHDEMNSDS